MNIHPINTKTFHTCLYFLSTLIHFWKKWLLKSTAIVKSLYCKETPESKVNLLQTWNTFMLEPYNLILETGQLKTLYFHYNIDTWKVLQLQISTDGSWFTRAQTCDFKHSHGVKMGRIHSSSSNVLTPKAKQQQRAAGRSYVFMGNSLCSAVHCASTPHCSAGWWVQCVFFIWHFIRTRCLLHHNPIVYRGSSHKRHFTAQCSTLSTPENANTLTVKGLFSQSHASLQSPSPHYELTGDGREASQQIQNRGRD